MSKVAIITPTYNRGSNGLLEKAMLSVLGQTYTDFVYIVVDDGSTDNTRDIVTGHAKYDERVMYVRRERTADQKFGASPARNRGIGEMNNISDIEYVTFLDSDDMFPRSSVEKRVQALEDQKGLVVCSPVGFCYKNMDPRLTIRTPVPGDNVLEEILQRQAKGFPYGSLMFRKELLAQIGLFDEGIGYGEDRDFAIRTFKLLRNGQLSFLPDITYYHRKNNGKYVHITKGTVWKRPIQ